MSKNTGKSRRIVGIGKIALLIFDLFRFLPDTGAQDQIRSTIPQLAARAEQYERDGRWVKVAGEYRKILQLDPQSVPAYNRLCQIYIRLGKLPQAIEYYQKALELYPDEFGTNLNLGLAYFKMGNYASAIDPFEQAVRRRPSHTQARKLLALSYIALEKYSTAVGLQNWDFTLTKNITVTEQVTIQFRSEFYNAFNNTHFNDPDTSLGSASYNKITSTRTSRGWALPPNREIQFGLKVLF